MQDIFWLGSSDLLSTEEVWNVKVLGKVYWHWSKSNRDWDGVFIYALYECGRVILKLRENTFYWCMCLCWKFKGNMTISEKLFLNDILNYKLLEILLNNLMPKVFKTKQNKRCKSARKKDKINFSEIDSFSHEYFLFVHLINILFLNKFKVISKFIGKFPHTMNDQFPQKWILKIITRKISASKQENMDVVHFRNKLSLHGSILNSISLVFLEKLLFCLERYTYVKLLVCVRVEQKSSKYIFRLIKL